MNPFQTPPIRKVLSCTNCRRRKIKCDKFTPCHPCLKYELQCIYPTRRPRASKAKGEVPENRDAELLRRINRLEGLLVNQAKSQTADLSDSRPRDSPIRSLLPRLPSSGGPAGSIHAVPIDDHYAAFVKQQNSSSRHINSEFWSSLGDEAVQLRPLLEGGTDEEEEEEDDFVEVAPQLADGSDGLTNLIFQDAHNFPPSSIKHPSSDQIKILFRFYFDNVDPVWKILHQPTALAYSSSLGTLLDPQTRRLKFESLDAVTFAVYFAAVNSMTHDECEEHLMEAKDVLVARYKGITELALVQADFLNSLEILTLQAFAIYIVVQRSLAQSKSTWTLVGLAVRIAQGLGLHRGGDGREFRAFEAEMRRRLWWCIVSLEMKASEDRGSETTLTEESFNTAMPCNLNDEDFSYDSQHPLQSRTGPTEMTLPLLAMDALCTAHKINFGSCGTTLSEREELVKKYTERVESAYLVGYDFSDRREKLLYVMGHYWSCKLWLNLYYPLQQQAHPQPPPSVGQGLQRAERILSLKELTESHPSSAGFLWLFKSYAPWHAVAVMLAELCTRPQDPLADRGWSIIESRFQDWNDRITDVKERMIWGQLKKLLKRARAAREQSLQSATSLQRFSESTPDIGLENESFDFQLETESDFLNHTFGTPTQFFPSEPIKTTLVDAGEANSIPVDSWISFMNDVIPLDRVIPPGQFEM